MARDGWPGCAAVLVRRGEEPLIRCLGTADTTTGRPVNEDTGFRIGSTGKTFTALTLAALLEQRAVGLDDPFAQHVPTFSLGTPGAGPVRLRHLASHTSGLGEVRDWRDLLRPKAGAGVRPGAARPELDELYRTGLATDVPPGVLWRYANHGIAALGSVIEHAAGESFATAVDRLALKPLGLDATGFGPEWLDDPRTAAGYARVKGTRKRVSVMDIAVAPAGSAVSRATDMARYLTALFGEGGNDHGRAVSAKTYGELLQPLHQPDPRQTQTATVWWLDRLDGHRIQRHGGAWTGFRSCCVVAPDDGVGLWLGVNGEEDSVEHVGLNLLRDLLGARSTAEELRSLQAVAPPPPAGRYTPVGTARYTLGTWSTMRGGVSVTSSHGLSCIRSGGAWRAGFPLQPIDPQDGTLFAADTGAADFLSSGYTTVQLMGSPTQPMLLLNGRTPYVRSSSRRPWTHLDDLEPDTRGQLERLCLAG